MRVRNIIRKVVRFLIGKNEANKSTKINTIETIEQNASKAIYFLTLIDNLLKETKLMTTPLGKIITRNRTIGT